MEFIEIRALAGRVIKTYTRVEWVKHDPISNSTRVPAEFPLSLSLSRSLRASHGIRYKVSSADRR